MRGRVAGGVRGACPPPSRQTPNRRAGPQPIRLEPGAVPLPYRSYQGVPVLEAFFSALLVLVCVGVLAFAGVTVKKLYQGQR